MPRFIEAVSVAVRRGDALLLVRRGRAPSLGLYAFPGGRVEPGEALEAAARRELWEETGMVAGALALFATIELAPEADPGIEHFRLSVFQCADAHGEPQAGDDAAEAGFFRLSEMGALPITPSTLEAARRMLA